MVIVFTLGGGGLGTIYIPSFPLSLDPEQLIASRTQFHTRKQNLPQIKLKKFPSNALCFSLAPNPHSHFFW